MDEMYKDIYKKLMTLQWLLRRYQMMNCKEHNIYENRNEGQGRVLALLKIQPEIATKDMAYLLGIKQQSLNELLKKLEKSGYVKEEDEDVEVSSDVVNEKRVLVLCAGGGTSGLLANALAKGADEQGISIITAAGSYGAHYDMLKDYDLVVLAPQVANYYEDLKKDTDRIGIKCVACEGKKYIELTRNPQKALQFVFSILDGEE